MTDEPRADLHAVTIVHTDAMPWRPGPDPGVEHKPLWREGTTEAGWVTALLRYAPGGRCSAPAHPHGEEILVLDGVLRDARGEHGAGTYLRRPEGDVFGSSSVSGCTLLVERRQHPGGGRASARIDTHAMSWEPYVVEGVWRKPLYAEPDDPESMHILRMDAGHAEVPVVTLPRGEALLVLEGTMVDEHGAYRSGTWVRYPPGTRLTPRTNTGCRIYVKKGHLGR